MKDPNHFKCPGCGSPFSAADVDARQGTVVCGSCGHAVPWNSLIRESGFREVPDGVPKRLTVRSGPGGVTLTYRHPRSKTLFFLGFTLIWGLFTIVLAVLAAGPAKTDFALPVFATLFAVSEVFIIFLCLDMLLGKAVVRVQPGRASLFRGIGPFGSTWTFLLPMESSIAVERLGEHKNEYYRISVPQPSGRPFHFCGGISDLDVLEYIARVLRRFRA